MTSFNRYSQLLMNVIKVTFLEKGYQTLLRNGTSFNVPSERLTLLLLLISSLIRKQKKQNAHTEGAQQIFHSSSPVLPTILFPVSLYSVGTHVNNCSCEGLSRDYV